MRQGIHRKNANKYYLPYTRGSFCCCFSTVLQCSMLESIRSAVLTLCDQRFRETRTNVAYLSWQPRVIPSISTTSTYICCIVCYESPCTQILTGFLFESGLYYLKCHWFGTGLFSSEDCIWVKLQLVKLRCIEFFESIE